MDQPEDALKAVNAAIAKCKARDRKRLADTSGHVSTHLVLLKMSSISKQLGEKLATFLRNSLGVLYAAVPVPALRLAAAIFESVYHNRIITAIMGAQLEQKDLWESVLHALLSGVLDFLDAHDTEEAKSAIGEALYTVLCDVCFSLTAPKTGVDLRCTAYNILTDAAASSQGNQNLLRDPKVLGGERLGSCIWRTKDYLALEGLLNLFARTLPSTNNSASGRAKRTAFIHSVFKSTAPPEAATIADSVLDLLENVPSSDWEETSVKIVDAFARGNISYPQPFSVTELMVNDRTYPSDRLYADDKTLLANVLLGEDQYESLEIVNASIERIRLDSVTIGRVRVTLDLSTPPRLGKDPIKPRGNNADRGLNATFLLQSNHAIRLSEALDSRGLSHLVTRRSESPPPKLSLAVEPAHLEVDSAGRLVEPSQSERIENVSQFYRTDEPSDDIQSAGDFDEFVAAVEVSSQPINPFTATGAQDSHQNVSKSKTVQSHQLHKPSSPFKPTALARTGSQLIRDAGLGDVADDLSDISTDPDSPTPMTRLLRRTSSSASAKLVRGRLSFEPVSAAKEAGRMGRGRVGKVILDSDDDSPPATPAAKPRPRPANKALLREPTADDALEESPVASLVPVPLEPPATPPSQQDDNTRVASTGLGLQSGSAKVLRFSNVIPAPDFNAALSSPAVVPMGVLKSALVKKPPAPAAVPDTDLLDSSPPRAQPVRKTRAAKPAILKAEDPLYDLIPPASSPTPGAKRSVRAALRKKDEPASAAKATKKKEDPPATAAANKPAKRKALAEVEADENVPPAAVDSEPARPAKRARTSATVRAPTPVEHEDVKAKLQSDAEVQALRPAMRARKQYRARKGRTSSPVAGSDAGLNSGVVDYDALPSPPRAQVAPSAVRSTPPRKVKTKAAEVEKSAKIASKAKTEDSNTVAQADDAKKTAKGKAEKVTNTEKVTKPEKPVKAEKAEKATIKEAMKTKAAEDLSPPVDKVYDSAATTAPRVPPRPRRVGSKDKVKEITEQDEVHDDPPSRPVRTSARAAAAAEKRRAQEKVEQKQIQDDPNVAANQADDMPMEACPELPLFVDNLQAEIELATKVTEPKSKKKAVPAIAPRVTEAKGNSSATKKSKKTPWDALAEQGVLHIPVNVDDSTPVLPDVSDVTNVDEDLDASLGLGADITLVQPPSPVSVHKKLVSTSTPKPDTAPAQVIEPKPHSGMLYVPTAPPTISKSSPVIIKREVETIDLTVDTPPKAPKRRISPKVVPTVPQRRSPRLASPTAPPTAVAETLDIEDVGAEPNVVLAQEYLPEPPPRTVARPTVRFVSESLQSTNDTDEGQYGYIQRPSAPQVVKPNLSFSKKQAARRKQEEEVAQNERPVYHSDSTVQRIVEVLEELHKVVVQSVMNKFEGVREEVRVGRDELLRRAADDLHAIRAESVVHFNSLVDLEAEYATVGRNVKHGTEDWMKVSQEICRELSAAVETHDRSMLSKKMPATLVSVQL